MLADIQWWIWTWYQCHHNYTGGVQCRLHHMVITIHMEEYSAGYITWWLQCTWWSTMQATSHGDYNTHGGIQCRLHHMVITIHMVEYNAGYITWWLQCTWWSTVQATSHGDYNAHGGVQCRIHHMVITMHIHEKCVCECADIQYTPSSPV